MKLTVPSLFDEITSDVFLDDIDHHFESMTVYKLPEFSLPSEENKLAPATTDFYEKKVGK